MVQTRLKEAEITQAMQDPTVRVAEAACGRRPAGPPPSRDQPGAVAGPGRTVRPLGRRWSGRWPIARCAPAPMLSSRPSSRCSAPSPGRRRSCPKGSAAWWAGGGAVTSGSSPARSSTGSSPCRPSAPPSGPAASELADRLVLQPDTPARLRRVLQSAPRQPGAGLPGPADQGAGLHQPPPRRGEDPLGDQLRAHLGRPGDEGPPDRCRPPLRTGEPGLRLQPGARLQRAAGGKGQVRGRGARHPGHAGPSPWCCSPPAPW